jgi:hypothetical protein
LLHWKLVAQADWEGRSAETILGTDLENFSKQGIFNFPLFAFALGVLECSRALNIAVKSVKLNGHEI